MADGVQLPSDIELSQVMLRTGDGKEVNITDLTVEVSIYESINSAAIFGRIVIVDAASLLTQTNISGQEILTIRVTKQNVDDEHIFHVSNVEQAHIVNETTTQYTLTFVDRTYVVDSSTLISQAYEGTIDSIIKEIYENEFGEELQEADECAGTYKLVIPNWKPLEAINWLTNRAKNANGVPMVFFKTLRRGAKLQSYETLMNEEVVNQYVINATPDLQASIQGNQYNSALINKKPQSFKVLQHGNALNQIRNGTYAQTFINVDTVNKSTIVKDFAGEDIFEKNPRLNKFLPATTHAKYGKDSKNITELVKAKQTVSYNQGPSFGDQFLNYDSEAEDIDTMLDNYVGMNSTYMYEMVVHGRFDLEPGRCVDIVFPANRVQDSKNPDDNIDNKRSGKHLILACHHNFKRDTYTCVIEVGTDGFGEEYGSQ